MLKWNFALGACWFVAATMASVPAVASETAPTAGPAATASRADWLRGHEVEALFSPDVDPDRHAAARKRAIKLAMAGNGPAAFDLGVMYRHGMDHPARAVERDLDTARSWLERCVEGVECPRMALASLAELELQAKNYPAAMQWAQAAATLEQELDKVDGKPYRADQASYFAYLLQRCFQYLPKQGREAAVEQSFAEFLARHGRHLDRMLANAQDKQAHHDQHWVEFAAARHNHRVVTNRVPKVPALGLFLLRASAQGGRAESAVLIEALPSPRDVLGLDGVARRFESKAYRPESKDDRRYGFLPITVADPRYELKAQAD